jgi:hypothetical protein
MRGYLLLFLCSLIFLLSCKKDTLNAPAASFLFVNTVSVNTTSAIQGSNSHKITDMWYYVNGEFKGVFPVGSVMPIVATDNAEITLFAGIKNNGISATRTPYQFYKAVNYIQALLPGKTYTISPEFEYTSNAIFYYQQPQNFDSSVSQFEPQGDSSYVRTLDPNKTFGGTGGSIFMSMSDAKPTSKMVQSINYFLPAGGTTIYLELNYKCNQTFVVGVIGDDFDERDAITVNSSTEWNKIYIQLTGIVSAQPLHLGYKVFIKATKEVNIPEIYIDNIKLISY